MLAGKTIRWTKVELMRTRRGGGCPCGKLWWKNGDWKGSGADMRELKYDKEKVMWHGKTMQRQKGKFGG
jgi:hypothetical protein